MITSPGLTGSVLPTRVPEEPKRFFKRIVPPEKPQNLGESFEI
jgi:hypothetical protein